MEVQQVRLIYFSPTGTTQKVLESIAKGIAVDDVEHINLTLPEGAQRAIRVGPSQMKENTDKSDLVRGLFKVLK